MLNFVRCMFNVPAGVTTVLDSNLSAHDVTGLNMQKNAGVETMDV